MNTSHIVQPTAIYSRTALVDALNLKSSTITREIRLGRLRVATRGGRQFFLGSWILDWIATGENCCHESAIEETSQHSNLID